MSRNVHVLDRIKVRSFISNFIQCSRDLEITIRNSSALISKKRPRGDFRETLLLRMFISNSHAEFHEIPTKCLVADARLQNGKEAEEHMRDELYFHIQHFSFYFG